MLTLETMLHPVTRETFLREYWELRPLHIPGHPGKFRDFFDVQKFREVAIAGCSLLACFEGETGQRMVPVEASQVEASLESGATLCLSGLEGVGEAFSRLAAALKTGLGYTGTVSLRSYFSADGHGFNTHFDARVATTLQIEGRKRWRFSKTPGIRFPRHNAVPAAGGGFRYARSLDIETLPWEHFPSPDPGTFEEVLLEPGDVLCLPAGTWHQARAEGRSLAINVAFEHCGMVDFLATALHPMLSARPEWRRPLPIPSAGKPVSGEMPREVQRFLRARLEELRSLVDKLSPEDLADAWHRQTLPNFRQLPPTGREAISRQSVFSLSTLGTSYGLARDPAGNQLLFLYQASPFQKLGYDPGLLDFFRAMFAHTTFSGAEALAWEGGGAALRWQDLEVFLADLVERGILRVQKSIPAP
jgi:ribosomal protein L16 Arg81 hydroxylase